MKCAITLVIIFVSLAVPLAPFQSQQRDMRLATGAGQEINQWPSQSKLYALLVGVNAYDDPQFKPLIGTSNDKKPFAMVEGYRANDLVIATAGAQQPAPRPAPAPTPAAQMSVAGVPMSAMIFMTAEINRQGQIVNRRQEQCRGYVEDLGNGVKLEMVEIPAGEFFMGENAAGAAEYKRECGRYFSDKAVCKEWANWTTPQHKVRINGFLMGKYEVTQRQWKAVMGNLPPGMSDLEAKCQGEDLPVAMISWYEAQAFVQKLGKGYRLPSEAEWEYAARAGTRTAYAFGATISPEVVNYKGNCPRGWAGKCENRDRPVAVGSLGLANAWGLFDMNGNVWEWCEDDWHDRHYGAPTDGRVWVDISSRASSRVIRGGGWGNIAVICRSAFRSGFSPGYNDKNLGFRLSRTAR